MPNPGVGTEAQVSDVALVRRVVDGDEVALAALYDRYGGVAYSVALRVLRDPDAAEEVLQDIFYQLWQQAASFDPGRGSLGAWLLVMARNRAISRLRRSGPGTSEEFSELKIAAPWNLETAVAQKQVMAQVIGVLEKLPPPQRQAIELAYFEGLTHSEIAQRTGEPLGTVKTRLRAALETLKRALNP